MPIVRVTEVKGDETPQTNSLRRFTVRGPITDSPFKPNLSMGNYENNKNLSGLRVPQSPQNFLDMALQPSVSLQNQQTPTMPHHRLPDESSSAQGDQQSPPDICQR